VSKLSLSTNPSEPRSAGFTLVEALAALTVMAIGMAAIGELSNSSLRSGLYFERHLAEIQTARKIVAGLPARKDLPYGSLSGVLDSHKWRIDAAPFPNTLAPVNGVSDWRPQMLVLHVVAPTGSVVEIDTIRLSKRALQ
jgi:prepilin-type N-terminal cleavage/methylation domain-containing protein